MGLLFKSRIKIDSGRREVHLFHKGGCLSGAVFPVHAAVLPFYRQGTVVTDPVQCPDYFLEIDFSASQGTEIPVSAWGAKFRVPSENASGGGSRLSTKNGSVVKS